jgi:hypothetical protein
LASRAEQNEQQHAVVAKGDVIEKEMLWQTEYVPNK